jgi:hypothetical protein
MFITGCLLLLFAVVMGYEAHRLKGSSIEIMKPDSGHHGILNDTDAPSLGGAATARALGMVSYLSASAGVLFVIAACLTSVNAGQVGVPVIYGSVQPYFIPEGLHTINPFASVKEMSVRSQTYTMVSAEGEGQVRGDDSIFA